MNTKSSNPMTRPTTRPPRKRDIEDAFANNELGTRRARPDIETKFPTANILIQVEKPEQQMSLFDSSKIKDLERELKKVRHEIFSAKPPSLDCSRAKFVVNTRRETRSCSDYRNPWSPTEQSSKHWNLLRSNCPRLGTLRLYPRKRKSPLHKQHLKDYDAVTIGCSNS